MSGDSVDTLEVHTEPFEMEGGEEEEQRPAVNGVVFSKVKAVERHRVRGSVPRDGPALQQPGTPNTDALSWRVRKRSPQFIRAECTDSVIIQADPPTPEERRSEVQREITKRAERQRRHTNGSICPPAIIRVCLPGRFKSSRSAKNSQPWDSAKHLPNGQIRIEPPPELIPFLPPQLPKDKGKKTLVLDLDETLVRSSFARPAVYTFVIQVELDGKKRSIYINRRPGVSLFLEEVSKWFELVIFTASVSKYADMVVDQLDPLRLCSWRLFREYCTYMNGTFVKDLSYLGRELRNVIIVDNSTRAYLWHSENAIPIRSWFEDPHDHELLDLIPILQSLATVEDIRPVIREVLSTLR